jgi:hypothetical protein
MSKRGAGVEGRGGPKSAAGGGSARASLVGGDCAPHNAAARREHDAREQARGARGGHQESGA